MAEYFEKQVQRQQARRDPLSRLPWQAAMALAVLILTIGLLQTLFGTGVSRVLGLALLLWIGPLNVVTALATREARRRGPA